VPPIAAVREGATLPPGRLARFGPATGIAVLAIGIALVCVGAFVHGISTVSHLVALGAGALAIFIGVAIFAPQLVKPLASVLGWPGTKLGGSAGRLAQENTLRNPKRTASTASALMIGLALVTFVSVFAAGLRGGFNDAVNKLFVANYALTSSNGFDPLSADASAALLKTPGVQIVSPIRAGAGRLAGKIINVTGVDANVNKVIAVKWAQGSPAVPGQLGSDGGFVSKKYAKDHKLVIGSPLAIETPTARIIHVRVKGIFDPPPGGSPFGTVTISKALFDQVYPAPNDLMTLIDIRGGVSLHNTDALKAAIKDFPNAKVQTQSEFKTNQARGINQTLLLLYVLLALSIVISVFGIVNTLVLTVFERTREIGMLRAIGMTRRQVRRMIRYESIVTSLIGGVLGIAVGIFLGLLIIKALKDQGLIYAVPVGTLVVFVLATILIGILAAIFPARRAARLNVLEALQYE
jgi:putative ABC transport system permease protein